MKKYVNPAIELIELAVEDILTARDPNDNFLGEDEDLLPLK